MKKVITVTLLLMSSLFAELKVGDAFPSLALVDQFDEKVEILTQGERQLIFSFEKEVFFLRLKHF